MKKNTLPVVLALLILSSCSDQSSNNQNILSKSNTVINTANSNNSNLTEAVEQSPSLILVVTLSKDGKLNLNNDKVGNLSDTSTLENKLKSVFAERKKHGLYEKGNFVYIKAKKDTIYKDVVKVIDAVKKSEPKDIKIVTEN